MSSIAQLLASYPRIRPELPPAQARIYEEQYKANREGAHAIEGLAQRLERWMHRQVARIPGGPILELGAGTLNHVQYEASGVAYDVVEPFRALYAGRPEATRVRNFHDSVAQIADHEQYARVISVAVLEHMDNLPREVAQAALHLTPNGVFQAGIPSEGGFLWWLGWRCSTGLSYYLRTGHDYGRLMRHEHLNTAPEILAVVRYFFGSVAVRRFPLPHHQLSFYTYLEARAPDRARCQAFLDGGSARASD